MTSPSLRRAKEQNTLTWRLASKMDSAVKRKEERRRK
eukprot:COSAG01_NODE_20935_length_926_cov_13.022975_3_plen_36_part_01